MTNFSLLGQSWNQSTVTWFFDGETRFDDQIARAFGSWDAQIDLDFSRVTSASQADIVLQRNFIDGPSNTLGVANSTFNPVTNFFIEVTITFDSAEILTDSANGPVSNNGVTFNSTALHEIGHAIGLDHSANDNTIMFAFASASVLDLTAGDIAGAQTLYGIETTNTTGTVNQLFQSILQREPDTTETSNFVAAIDSAAFTVAQIRDTLINSTEAEALVDPVIRIYQAAFGRKPDQAGLDVNVDAVRSGLQAGQSGITIEQLADAFTVSQEFTDRFGGNTINLDFVTALYASVLNRTPDQVGLDTFLGPTSTITAGQALIIFSNSVEFIANSAADVDRFLQEAADGIQNFTGSLSSTATSSSSVASVLATQIALENKQGDNINMIDVLASGLQSDETYDQGDTLGDFTENPINISLVGPVADDGLWLG